MWRILCFIHSPPPAVKWLTWAFRPGVCAACVWRQGVGRNFSSDPTDPPPPTYALGVCVACVLRGEFGYLGVRRARVGVGMGWGMGMGGGGWEDGGGDGEDGGGGGGGRAR